MQKEDLEELIEDEKEDHDLDFLTEKEPKKSRGMTYFIVFTVIFIIVAVLVVFNPVLLKLDKNKIMSLFSKKTTTVEQPKVEEEVATGLLSGQLIRLDKKLGLTDTAPWESMGDNTYNPEDDAIYYEAGTYNSGEYKGYKRIILIMSLPGLGGNRTEILATNDEKNYVLNGNSSDAAKYKRDDWESPLYGLREDKVVKVDWLPTEQPEKIDLEGGFALYRGEILNEYVEISKDHWETIIGKYSGYQKEEEDLQGLRVYLSEAYKKPDNYSELDKDSKAKIDQYIQYTNGYSSVILVDSTGLPYTYHLGNKTVTISSIKPTDLNSSSGLYSEYGYAFPGGCGGRSDTLIAKNISESDLEKVTTMKKDGIEIYKLKDKNHPLLKLAYDEKTGFMYTGDYNQPYTITSTQDIRPSFESYISKVPLLFFKDSFGRWNMFVEYQYLMPGGCGKPVLYFYPEKPTEISVSFTKDMLLTRDIPSYKDGWKILADEKGDLKDLNPVLTDCSKINDSLKGLEYAKKACENSTYPYLYWAGDVRNSEYPEQRNGWVVSGSELKYFMNEKLDIIGLSAKEKGDMLGYWIPEMLAKNTPYYKVSFIQTKTMNSFIPMNINPKPDSIGRVFLDWLPLENKIELEPQKLEKINRTGFTVIEWGGIKR